MSGRKILIYMAAAVASLWAGYLINSAVAGWKLRQLTGPGGRLDESAQASKGNPLDWPQRLLQPTGPRFTIDTTKVSAQANDVPDPFFHPVTSAYGCGLPRPAPDETIVLFSLYEGQALSSVAIDDVNLETRAADIEIEPGEKPLYLVLASFDAMVWRFKGATQRVAKLMLISQRQSRDGGAAAGAVGIDANRILSFPAKACFQTFDQAGSRPAKAAVAALRQQLGREPDIVGAAYEVSAVRLPSGMAAKAEEKDTPAPAGFDQTTWNAGRRFFPAGLIQISPEEVHGTRHAQAYDILPIAAGVAQLVGSGAIEDVRGGFRIVKPIAHYPASLTGAHSTRFLLAPGVPAPAGDPGHSCVIDEASGQPLKNTLCR